MRLLPLLSLLLVLACTEKSKPPAQAGVPGRTGTSRIAGVVRLVGTAPPPPRVTRGAPPECRKNAQPPREAAVQVGPGGEIAEAFVWVREGLPEGDYPLPAAPVEIDQRGCEYIPRVVGVRAGQPIAFRNSDDALHNVHARGSGSNQFNFGMPLAGMETKRTFSEPQVMVPIGCDVHPWMRAYAGVSRHPFFAVTGADGKYSLEGLPPGSYTVEAWQEALPQATASVTLGEGESKTADFGLHQ
ncbi:MAG: carboxypeptidase regulatory-like domain-containing protein [Myxococcales bacterium]